MIKINGVEVLIYKNSLAIDAAIEERSTCSFSIIDNDGTLEFRKGQNVEIYNDELIFAGVINSTQFTRLSPSPTKIHHVSAIDWHYLADKRIIAKAYENQFAGDIVKDVVSSKLLVEGVIFEATWQYYAGLTWAEL